MMQQDPFRPHEAELREICKQKILTRVDSSRQFQLLMALRNELYWRGKQYLKFKFMSNGVTVVPLSGPPSSPGNNDPRLGQEPQALSYVFNITRSDGQKFSAIVGARPPGINFEPKDAQDADAIKAARDAKAVGRYLADLWDSRQQQKDLARTIFRSGPQFGHVCWVVDKKYGKDNIQDTNLVDVNEPPTLNCQECGIGVEHPGVDAPATPCRACGSATTTVTPGASYKKLQSTTRSVDRGMPELHQYTIFEVATPPERTKLKDCEWLSCEKLEYSGKIRRLYGHLVEHIQDETPSGADVASQETAAEVFDIIGAADPQAANRQDRWWWTRIWLTPDMYAYASPALQKTLAEHAPDGLRFVTVNNNYVEAVPEKLTDVWVVCKTGTDDKILGDPICHDLIPINEIINNFFNLAIETMLRGIPKTVVDPRLVDRTAIMSNSANVAEIIFAKAGLGQDLSKMITQLPTARFSDQMMPLATLFRQYSREIDGVMEVAFGGGDAAPTWRQDQQRKNQALAQFYVAYDEMRAFWEEAHRLALNLLAKYGVGEIEIPSDDHFTFGAHTVNLQTLTPDKVKVESEETMPQTRAEEVDALKEQFTLPPQIQEGIGLFHPINMMRTTDLLNIRGMVSPYSHMVEKTVKIIGELLQGQPMQPPPPLMMPGQPPQPPPPPEPSMQPDPFEFKNAAFAVEIVRAFVNSPAGMEYAQQVPAGFENVKLFGMALDKMANPPAAPPPPRASVGVTLNGKDLGDTAVQAALLGANIIPDNVPVQAVPDPVKPPPAAKAA